MFYIYSIENSTSTIYIMFDLIIMDFCKYTVYIFWIATHFNVLQQKTGKAVEHSKTPVCIIPQVNILLTIITGYGIMIGF